jgi:hypothetical protein
MPETTASPGEWYRDGLRFTCTRCGRCCGGAPGYVWIAPDEAAVLARRLGLDAATFAARYTRAIVGRGTSLVERARGDCVFFDPSRRVCAVYEDRPRQCRTWPFWRQNVSTPAQWASTLRACPGAGRGRLHMAADVAGLAASDGVPEPPAG